MKINNKQYLNQMIKLKAENPQRQILFLAKK